MMDEASDQFYDGMEEAPMRPEDQFYEDDGHPDSQEMYYGDEQQHSSETDTNGQEDHFMFDGGSEPSNHAESGHWMDDFM